MSGRSTDTKGEEKFHAISFFNVEGKVFFSVIAQRLNICLDKNKFVDMTIQKAGISGFSGCLEHTNMIRFSQPRERRETFFLDLANTFGSVPVSVLWAAFKFFRIPEPIKNLVKDFQFCFRTLDFTSCSSSCK